MHLNFSVSAAKHTISIGNMDLRSRYMWPGPKLCHAMAWKRDISCPAELCFVFFGKAVSVQLCKLKIHHWCNCARLHQSQWICCALYQSWIILRALKCSSEWLWAHPLLQQSQARIEIEKQKEKARDRHRSEQSYSVKANPCGGFWDYLKDVVNDSE